jgi:hypothetical protein
MLSCLLMKVTKCQSLLEIGTVWENFHKKFIQVHYFCWSHRCEDDGDLECQSTTESSDFSMDGLA